MYVVRYGAAQYTSTLIGSINNETTNANEVPFLYMYFLNKVTGTCMSVNYCRVFSKRPYISIIISFFAGTEACLCTS